MIAAVLFAGALALRLVDFKDRFVHFHPTRQFHDALIARGLYLRASDAPHTPRVKAALRAEARRGMLEPQIVETIAATGYRISGGEHPAIPRAVNILISLLGGVALLGAGRRLMGPLGALVAAAVYVFQPYALVAGEAFQPDPLMLALTCLSLLTISRYDEEPTLERALAAGVSAGLAGLVKPVCLPLIGCFHLALRLRKSRIVDLLKSRHEWTIFGCVAVPLLGHYVRNIVLGNRLDRLSGMTFRPHLLLTKHFWHAWPKRFGMVYGSALLLFVVPLGIVCARGRLRWGLAGLFLGYFICGLIFNFHFSTHEYYHLALLPAYGLALGSITEAAVAFVRPRALVLRLAALAVAAVAVGLTARRLVTESLPLLDGDLSLVARYEAIGDAVGHSDKVLFATDDAYGAPLEFYGWLSGSYFEIRKVSWGLKEAPKHSLATLERAIKAIDPKWFVCSPAELLELQPRTREYLEEHAVSKKANDEYVVYELGKKSR